MKLKVNRQSFSIEIERMDYSRLLLFNNISAKVNYYF
jgi:hypothetical protein